MSCIVLLTLYLLHTAATLEPGYPFHHDDILEKCACSPAAFEAAMMAWRGFNQEAEIIDAGCHPYQNGSKYTLGIESGQVWEHPSSVLSSQDPAKPRGHFKYVIGLNRLLNRLHGSFGGSFSFGITTTDEGSSSLEPPLYGVHASLPTKQPKVSVILPIDTSYQSDAFLQRIFNSSDVHNTLPFLEKKLQAFWRGRSNAKAYRQRLVNRISQLPRTFLGFNKVTMSEFSQNQMLIAMDGNSYSSVFKEALLTESVVIRLRKENRRSRAHQEWFEPMLQNFRHFIAVDDTPQAVNQTIAWVLANQKEASLIGLEGSAFGRKIFSRPFTFCYSCVTLHLAATHQKLSSTCPPNTSFEKMGWQLLNIRSL
jgi:molybdopterin-guanine dinucleotide biosynthesis protein A